MLGTSKSVWGFDPRSVPGCSLWLDAADASTLTFSSGSNVSSWRDKSINVSSTTSVAGTNVLTQNAMNGRQAILLNGSSSFTGSTTGSGNTLTVCIVATQSNTCATYGGLVCFGRPGFDDWNDIGSLAITNFVGIGSGQMGSTRTANSQTVNTGVSTPFIYILVFDGTFVNSYLNGIIQTPTNISSTGTFAYTGYKIGTRAGATVNVFWTGFIGEVLVYNTGLSTSQRQQVEGYLAHKWGLTGYYSPTTPLSIPGCQLWLDGADSSTVTGTTTVTQWRDKSGNARHLGVGSGTTAYSSNAIQLNSSYMFVTSPVDLSKVTVFIVVKTTGGGNQTVFVGRPNSSLDYNSLDGFGFYMDTTSSVRFYGQENAGRFSTFNVNTSTPRVFSFQSSGTLVSGWVNGASQSGGTLASVRTSTAQGFAIGASWEFSLYNNIIANASLYEIIVYNSDVNTSQRQNIEGYLARKWGLYSALPSTHPFLSLKPHLRVFNPIDIPGCSLWLDGADQSSMTLSGSSVTQWRDKSGSSNHFTPTSGTPTSISDNGRTVVNFTSGTIMTSTNQITFTTSSAFFIVSRLNLVNASDIGMLLVFTNISGGDFSIRFYGPNGPSTKLGGTSGSGNGGDLATGAYYVNGTFNPSFGSSTYLNTYSLIATVAPQSGGTSYVTLSSGFMSRNFVGNIAEFLYYPGGVTSSQRQQVEGYLAHKWGLTGLPSTHSFKSFPPHLRVFNPIDISGCSLWLDPPDRSTVTLNGSNVSQLNDKSGLGYNMSQATSGNQPTYSNSLYGNSMVTFTQSSSTRLSNTSFPTFIGSGAASYFLVEYNMNAPSGNPSPFGYSAGPNFGLIMQYNPGFTGGLQPFSTGVSSFTSATPRLIFLYKPNVTSSNMTGFINGTSQTVSDTTSGTYSGTFSVGSGINGFISGNICELIVFNRSLTTSERQQVEGYLAYKWGLISSLPAEHPYKKLPPSS